MFILLIIQNRHQDFLVNRLLDVKKKIKVGCIVAVYFLLASCGAGLVLE